jgi:hypothetical protein
VVEIIELAGTVEVKTVAEVSTVVKLERKHGVTRLQQGQVDRFIGLCAGMGLDVGMVSAKDLLGAANGKSFDNVHIVAAAIITLAGITLGIFIG